MIIASTNWTDNKPIGWVERSETQPINPTFQITYIAILKNRFFHPSLHPHKGDIMKRSLLLVVLVSLLLASCAPSESAVQTAIAKTQIAKTELGNKVQTAIAQTRVAAPSSTPAATLTKIPSPTSKPLPTATSTRTALPPTPTSKPLPTRAPAQPTQSNLKLELTIKVTNQCSVQATVLFDGPMHLKYVVAAGETKELQAARGTYTYTINGIEGSQSPADLDVAVWTLTLCY